MKSFVYRLSPLDPLSLGCAAVFLVVLTMISAWIPARRAAAVDLAAALRESAVSTIPAMRRREFVTAAALVGAAATAAHAQTEATPRKGRLKQCVTGFPFDPKMPFEDRCREAARLGCVGYDLIGAKGLADAEEIWPHPDHGPARRRDDGRRHHS